MTDDTAQRLREIEARVKDYPPDWRETRDTLWLLAEIDRLRAENEKLQHGVGLDWIAGPALKELTDELDRLRADALTKAEAAALHKYLASGGDQHHARDWPSLNSGHAKVTRIAQRTESQ